MTFRRPAGVSGVHQSASFTCYLHIISIFMNQDCELKQRARVTFDLFVCVSIHQNISLVGLHIVAVIFIFAIMISRFVFVTWKQMENIEKKRI